MTKTKNTVTALLSPLTLLLLLLGICGRCDALSLGKWKRVSKRALPLVPLQSSHGIEFTPPAKFAFDPAPMAPPAGWKSQLLKASNAASFLCVLDCTILPVVTVVLPLFGLVAGTPAQMELLHQLGHSMALFFVLPFGGSATLLNYLYTHKKKRIGAIGTLGLLMVLSANAPHSLLHSIQKGMLAPLYPLFHAAHHGITHRLVNILGCACLLTSNFWSKTGKCFLACCNPRRKQEQKEGLNSFVTHAYANGGRLTNQLVVFQQGKANQMDY